MILAPLTILCAASENHWPVLQATAANKLEYALRWQRQLVIRKHVNLAPWGDRQDMMKHALTATEWLWFLGADTVITNMTIDAMTFCDPAYHLVIGLDINGINNDSMFMRNCPETLTMIDSILTRNLLLESDQAAMIEYFPKTPEFKVKVVSQRLFNSYPYGESEYGGITEDRKAAAGGPWAVGDFVVHYPGINLQKRVELANQHLGMVVR